jgi:hypothetical protein
MARHVPGIILIFPLTNLWCRMCQNMAKDSHCVRTTIWWANVGDQRLEANFGHDTVESLVCMEIFTLLGLIGARF